MSFNDDDPLAGILSDGSDDSFFDDDIIGKKKPAKKKTTPNAEKKNALFDLDSEKLPINTKPTGIFIDKDESKAIVKSDSKKGLDFDLMSSATVNKDSFKTEAKSKVTENLDIMKSPSKNKSASHDTLDILGELGVSKTTKPLEKGKSSQSLLDDILGGSSKTSASMQVRPSTGAKSTEFDFDSILGKSEGKQTVTPKNVTQKSSIKIDNRKEDSAPKKKSSEDWLGIFKDKEENIDDGDDDAGMPAWLGGGDSKKKKMEKIKKVASKPVSEDISKETKEIEKEDINPRVLDPVEKNIEQIKSSINTGLINASNEDIASEGATLYMQQQESQLMVALQLKAQEEKLAALQMRQKESQRVQREAALAQHAQLDAMLHRQAAHRQQMQAIISAHQERITQRIKALLGSSNLDQEGNVNGGDEIDPGPVEFKETPHMKEKKQLLQLVQSLQENHDKEIDLMETSYRRQLAFLEVSLSQSEERMKEESDKLVKFYAEKISWLEDHHHLHKKLTEDNLNELTERHKAENEMLRQQHLENVRVLQEHHASLMENIKKAVKLEQVLIHESAGFSSDLHELVKDVKENKTQCQILVESVQTLAENNKKDSERSLQLRESQINDILQQLKKERENFETEKTETRDMVKMMENRLKQMNAMIEEDAATMKQKKMEFEFEKATFNKQTEFAKNLLKKQDEEIKIMREEIQREYQEKISRIDEEKKKAVKDSAMLAKEKASIQNIKQELETLKAELQAQLEEVREERSKLNAEKQQMHMEEQRILAKSRDLDLLAKTAMERQSQADKKYSEAEFLQHKYEERIRRIQEHVVSLNTREKQIAREKVALSRERLNLHNERKQMESRLPCSLCKSSQNQNQYYEPNYVPDAFNVSVSRDYSAPNVEVNSAMNAIEQEMAFLMSRNFSLRHNTTSSAPYNEGRFAESRSGGEDLPSAQPESGTMKDFMDPKFMMLRLDVQQVLNNLDQSKKDDDDKDNVAE